MRFFAVVCLALVATNDAFIVDTFKDLGNKIGDLVTETIVPNLLPTLVNLGTTALVGAVGKRDLEPADLVALENAMIDETYELTDRMQKFKEMFEKLKQARTDGNIKEVAKEIFNNHFNALLQRLPENIRNRVQKTVDEFKARLAKKTEEAKTTQEDETVSRMDKMKAFMAKLKEAKEQGKVKEFLQKHMEEQKKAFLARLSPEQKQKYQERMDKMKKIQETMKACREEVMKTKKDGDNVLKMTMQCYKTKMAPEETKTQEDDTLTRQEKIQKAKEARAEFLKKKEEAEKAGKLEEFMKAHRAEMAKKKEEAKQKWLASLTPEQRAKYEARQEKMKKIEEAKKACREEVAKAKTDDSKKEDLMKMFRECMKKKMAPEETKTQEDDTMTREERMQKAKEARAEFLKKYAEAKAAGKLEEFLKAHKAEMEKKREEAKQKWLASLTPEQKAKYEERMEKMKQIRQSHEDCKAQVQKNKNDGDNVHKMFHDCLKAKMEAAKKAAETKTDA